VTSKNTIVLVAIEPSFLNEARRIRRRVAFDSQNYLVHAPCQSPAHSLAQADLEKLCGSVATSAQPAQRIARFRTAADASQRSGLRLG
jgi:hypothetical protein